MLTLHATFALLACYSRFGSVVGHTAAKAIHGNVFLLQRIEHAQPQAVLSFLRLSLIRKL